MLDGDKQEIVRRLGGELDSPHKFVRVAEAMAELGNDDEVLAWAQRGITETRGWQLGALYDLACATQTGRGEPLEVLRLRRAQHERMPSRSTYTALRSAAEALDAWAPERDAARAALRCHDIAALVDAVLGDGDHDLAWSTAVATPEGTVADNQWLRLAEARESDHPADALRVYQQVVDRVLVPADRLAYQQAVRILKPAAAAAQRADQLEAFSDYLAGLREQYRRRPTLIALLDKAQLS